MNPLFRFLYWNMNYHTEHHMYPTVPYHALPKLHEKLKDQLPRPYNGLAEAYREMATTFIRQQKDPSYFVRPVLPDIESTRA
jgi:fatty acid desaturase